MADLEDLVRIEAVERAQRDHPVVGLAAKGPVVDASLEAGLEPVLVVRQGRAGAGRRLVEPLLLRVGEDLLSGDHDLVDQAGHVLRRLDLELLPGPNLGHGRTSPVFHQKLGQAFQPGRHRRQPLRQRGEVAREQQEQCVARGVEGGRAALPEAPHFRVEEIQLEVVDLQLALEADVRRKVGRVDRPDGGQVRAVVGDLLEDEVTAPVPEPVVLGVDAKERRDERVVPEHAPEARFNEVIKLIVEWTCILCPGRSADVHGVEI